MRTLDRKLFRELWDLRAQILAIVLVIASGIGAFVALSSVWYSLDRARSEFYAEYRFGDLFASLVRAPLSVAQRIEELPDVEAVWPRILAGVKLRVEGFDEPIVGTLISLPDSESPPLNAIHLRRGRLPSPERREEVLVHEAFAQAHGLGPGSRVKAVLYGRLQELHIVGVALSPEFVYQVVAGSIFPDDARNGVFWMNERALAEAFDREGAFNDLVVRLGRGAKEARAIAAIDRILEPWGGLGTYGRDEQGSHRMLSEELAGLRSQAVVVTGIFLGVAAFLLQLVVGRIITAQREIIAVLRALGYRARTIGAHYLKMVAMICGLGAALGALFGIFLGRLALRAYAPFFRFPSLDFVLQPQVLVIGLVVALGSGLLATLGSVRRVVRLAPAEAMKPPAPAVYRRSWLEGLGLWHHLAAPARMIVRRIERAPLKPALSSLGIGLALAIMIAVGGLLGAIDRMVDRAFRVEQRQDATLVFIEPQEPSVLFEVRRLPGVLAAEPSRSVSVRLRHGTREESLALQGLPPGGTLRRVQGERGPLGLPPDGLLLSRELGRRLGAREGDRLEVQVREGRRPTLFLPVYGLVDDLVGLNAWIDLESLNAHLAEGKRISAVDVSLDPREIGAFWAAIERAPVVASAHLASAAVEVFEETLAATQNLTNAILAFFSSIIAVGVVYNTARILLSDSARELASLRVLGFTRGEISRIFLGEIAVQVIVALPLGLFLGWAFASLIAAGLPAELYRLPIHLRPRDILWAMAVILIASLGCALIVRRRLDKLDLVAVLKTRE